MSEFGIGFVWHLARLAREASVRKWDWVRLVSPRSRPAKRLIRPSEDILPVSRLQHGEWAPRRKCRVYNEKYAVRRVRNPPGQDA